LSKNSEDVGKSAVANPDLSAIQLIEFAAFAFLGSRFDRLKVETNS